MGEIVHFNEYRADPKVITDDVMELSKKDVHRVEQIRDSIETALDNVAA